MQRRFRGCGRGGSCQGRAYRVSAPGEIPLTMIEAHKGLNSPSCRSPGKMKGGCFSVWHCNSGGARTGDLGLGGKTAAAIAIVSMKDPIAAAPPIRASLRPILSTRNAQIPGLVTIARVVGEMKARTWKQSTEIALIMPKKPVISRFEVPAPTAAKIWGA